MLSFFATSRISGLASIVTAIKWQNFCRGRAPLVQSLGGGGLEPPCLDPLATTFYAYVCNGSIPQVHHYYALCPLLEHKLTMGAMAMGVVLPPGALHCMYMR